MCVFRGFVVSFKLAQFVEAATFQTMLIATRYLPFKIEVQKEASD